MAQTGTGKKKKLVWKLKIHFRVYKVHQRIYPGLSQTLFYYIRTVILIPVSTSSIFWSSNIFFIILLQILAFLFSSQRNRLYVIQTRSRPSKWCARTHTIFWCNRFELNYSCYYLYPEDNICLLLLQGTKHKVKFLYEDEYSRRKGMQGMLFQSYQLLLQNTIFLDPFTVYVGQNFQTIRQTL
jgi:hypothetical protein